jgi:hypothetical protein
MLFAMAVPSILAAAIADPENVRNDEIAGLIGEKSTFTKDSIDDERSCLTRRTEEL